MNKRIENLSLQARRMYALIVRWSEVQKTKRVHIPDSVMTLRAQLEHKQLPIALKELRSAGLVETKQSRAGCEYRLLLT